MTVRKLITAARMLANARKDHSIPLLFLIPAQTQEMKTFIIATEGHLSFASFTVISLPFKRELSVYLKN